MDKSNILSMKLEKSKKSQITKIDYFVPELNRNRTDEIEEQPHADLLDALKALNPFLAAIFHVPEEAKEFYEVTGYKYAGEKVILTGKISTDDGGTIGVATPAIDLENENYGFEDELSEILSTLGLEVYLFLSGKKTGVRQMTIDDSIKDNENDILSQGPENEENEIDEKAENEDFEFPDTDKE